MRLIINQTMRNTSLARRLEQLETQLAPPSDEDVLRVTVKRIGEPDKILEVPLGRPHGDNIRSRCTGILDNDD